ncbi:hypothetical protein NDU88_007597 [Pleurodeles waltl]|uniref:Uncharacterized protein n=1 Tax=Pleurodeles waltl TaxID=8319 RepID=A0AAV7NVE3_PLEWA|nr:hypothetical protein NDU88_007597 [Pleurodeles waltl]
MFKCIAVAKPMLCKLLRKCKSEYKLLEEGRRGYADEATEGSLPRYHRTYPEVNGFHPGDNVEAGHGALPSPEEIGSALATHRWPINLWFSLRTVEEVLPLHGPFIHCCPPPQKM